MGTVPNGTSTILSRVSLILSRSPPVERSITACAPYFKAVLAFSTSSSRLQCSLEVPMFALTLTLSPFPIPRAFGECMGLKGITIFPSATLFLMISTSIFSDLAISFICSVIIPFFASDIWVICKTPIC